MKISIKNKITLDACNEFLTAQILIKTKSIHFQIIMT